MMGKRNHAPFLYSEHTYSVVGTICTEHSKILGRFAHDKKTVGP